VTARRIAISGRPTPAEAAAAVACVELLLAERASAASPPASDRSPWWYGGLAADLHHLPPGADTPIPGGAG
jgi:hypothetical protein